MSELIVSMMTSVDGYIEGPRRELDWTVESSDFNAYCDEMLDGLGTMVFGRVSYEMMVKYWPAAEENPRDEWERRFARKMNDLPKIVVSRTLERAEWKNTRIVRTNLADEMRSLKQAEKPSFVFGGAGIIRSLRELGLIDEWRVIVHPVVLGSGTPLFTGVDAPLKLKPLRTQTLDSGVALLFYAAQ
jgi:dihydrofolate reductase